MINSNNNPDSANAVAPSNSANFAPTDGIYVGGDGDLKVDMVSSGTVIFAGLLAGTFLPICVKRVYATGTTATNILALRKTAQ